MKLFTSRSGSPSDGVEQIAPEGEVLPGYEVVSLMRRGGRLDTYDVYSVERDCRCVVKVLRPDRVHEPDAQQGLLREGQLLRDLAHPHLVRVYEAIAQPQPAMVMETLTGATLAALIDDAPLQPADAALLGRQVASALGYLHHHGWLHLDVKPSNIVVQAGRAVLIDLSLAAAPGDGRPHAGTYGYLAPEQVTGRNLTAASDVFGLGTTLGEALTGGLLPYGEEDRWTSGTAPRTMARTFRRRLKANPGTVGWPRGRMPRPGPHTPPTTQRDPPSAGHVPQPGDARRGPSLTPAERRHPSFFSPPPRWRAGP